MTAVAVEITAEPQIQPEKIKIIDDLDDLDGTEVMLGCGNDNPY